MKNIEVNNQNTLVNLSNSILKHFGVKTFHDSIPEIDDALKGHKKVVAVLFDGMGQNITRLHLKENSFIRSNYYTSINSTFPPTTAAATTAFLTGKYPIETGWLGWAEYFNEYHRNIILFHNVDYNSEEKIDGENIADKYFPTKKIFSLIEENNKDVCTINISRYPIQEDGPKHLLIDGVSKLRKALKTEMKGSTCIIVTQRIGTIMDADRIIVLDEGKIVGMGKHRELLNNCKVYKEIALSQLSEEEINNAT